MPEKLDTVLYTTESAKSKGRTNASLKAEDPANEEEFQRIVKANALTGENEDDVHTTGNDRSTGGGGNR